MMKLVRVALLRAVSVWLIVAAFPLSYRLGEVFSGKCLTVTFVQ